MTATKKSIIVVCLHHNYGFDEYNHPVLKKLVESFEPDYWEFLNPGTISIYFCNTTANATKADTLVRKPKEAIATDERLRGIGIGSSTGEMIVQLTWRGKIKKAPLGKTWNEAIKRAGLNGKKPD